MEFSRAITNERIDSIYEIKLKNKIEDLAFGIENLNIGLFLHKSLEGLSETNKIIRNKFHKIIFSSLTDKKLILVGDYFHV